ncbi:hypothetical protein PR202_gb22094 [Eleusine coracana subsp. coracana]|uniref:Uncharacterized protein n=1 Tax=Eleusine coracana subsp. coracana TaxID=191504 RepID=A0AAV5FCT3_ELECO|nr:hypothetical protein PR202_gb22094 [Eleusine coracana subsp. coracana]
MAGCDNKSSTSSSGEEVITLPRIPPNCAVKSYTEKKYGGITPKKPLISKDNERAYFDSADWVLGKQAANNGNARAAIESLKPKLKVQASAVS